MKKLFLFTNLFILSLALCLSAQAKDVGGLIEEDTVWTKAESPFIVKQHVTVVEDVTLTVEPGVTVKFDKDKSLLIDGTLDVRGTEAEKIIFTSNGAGQAGYWGKEGKGEKFLSFLPFPPFPAFTECKEIFETCLKLVMLAETEPFPLTTPRSSCDMWSG